MPVNPNETITKLDKQISQLKARKKAIENKEKQKVQKERTRLLIKLGEIAVKYTKCETVEQLEEYFKTHK